MRHSQQTAAVTESRTQTEQRPASFSAEGRDHASVLRLKQVAAIVGLGKSSIYRKVQEGTFPMPIKLGSPRASGWISSEVYDWIDEQIRRSREVP
jgi:prophage regulatory protein